MTATLTALHGDTWHSPRWAVAIGGQAVDLTLWHIRAEARDADGSTPTFDWTLTAGTILLGTSPATLADGTRVITGTVQLVIHPAGWTGKPRRWDGFLDVELSSDTTATPQERRTVVSARRFRVLPDVAR